MNQGMGVDFTIEEKAGPKISPMRTWEAVGPFFPSGVYLRCLLLEERSFWYRLYVLCWAIDWLQRRTALITVWT